MKGALASSSTQEPKPGLPGWGGGAGTGVGPSPLLPHSAAVTSTVQAV